MFVNRSNELKILNDDYKNNKFSLTILYGRRRVEKTTLLKEFLKDKPAIYFLATLENLCSIIERFKNLVAEFLKDDLLKSLEISDIKHIFSYLARSKFDKKLVIIIDEFQYLGKLDSSVPSQFQFIVDEILKNKNIHLILCGSLISMMYSQTLSYLSPLYGRRTSSIKLEALKFKYLSEFFQTDQK